MEKMEFLNQLFNLCVFPLLGALTVFMVKWINCQADKLKTETENETLDKYMDMLCETITQCVLATNQTYVDALKKEGKFDKEAQTIAFEKTYQAVLDILTEEAKKYITAAVGDFNLYLTQSIEAEVKSCKIE